MMKTGRILAMLACLLSGRHLLAATTLSVDASSALNSFVPYDLFGANCVSWADPRPLSGQIQAAGNLIERFPGGSWADAYHWNGTGAYAANGTWVPSSTTASMGSFVQSISFTAANIIDNSLSTVWMSSTDTDFPNNQWVTLSLNTQQSVDSVQVTWGTASNASFPYATQFTVQYWNPSNSQQWLVYSAPTNGWVNTTAANWSGNGGSQTVTFTAVTTGFLRVLMTQSSAGAGGAYSVAELHPFSGGTAAPLSSWDPVNGSSMNPAGLGGGWIDYSFDQFMAMLNAMTPKGQPLITVNMGTGTPQEAAAWVYYANLVKGYGIKYWELGNEMGGDWEAGGPLNASDYARHFIEFEQAMKAVDPTITCIGGAGSGYASNSELYDGNGYIKGFINRLAADSGGNKAGLAEGIVIHDYPGQGSTPAQKLAGLATEMPSMASSLTTQLASHPQASTVPIWITEFNSWCSNDANDITVRLDNALFLGEYLGEFIKQFGSRGFTQLWAAINGGSASTAVNGGDLGYLDSSGAPRADYWAMQMLAADWSSLGDTQTHHLVSSTSSQSLLKSYADLRPDGSLALLVDNTDPANGYACTVSLSGFLPAAQANAWSLSSANYVWETTSTPYHASTNTGPSYLTVTGVSSSFSYTFPAYSLTVLQFHAGGTPTPSPTATPFAGSPTLSRTPSPTFTPTASATPICGTLIDDFESLNDNGTWSGSLATRSIVPLGTAPSGAVTSGSNCMMVNLTSGAAYNNDFLRITNFTPTVLSGYTQLKLDIFVTAGMVDSGYNQLLLVADCAACANGSGTGIWYQAISADAPTLASGEQTLTYNISYAAGGLPLTATVSSLDFILNQGAAHTGALYVDDMRLIGSCSASSPTPSPMGTMSRTATPTPTRTGTPSPTGSPTSSASPSSTPSPTGTMSRTATPSATATQTSVPSTFTSTPTASPTFTNVPPGSTLTDTLTISPTASATPSCTGTGTATRTASPTSTATASPTATFSNTAGPSFTATSTLSPGPSSTSTGTRTPTPTASPSSTASLGGLRLLKVVPVPNPQHGPLLRLYVDVQGRADSFKLRLYSQALTEVASFTASGGSGWVPVQGHVPSLPAGTYFVVVQGLSQGRGSTAKAITLLWLP